MSTGATSGRRPRSTIAHLPREDSGVALATVLGTMAVLTLFVAASLAFAMQAIPQARRTQDFHSALAAAQTGVDDLVARLNHCDGYWAQPCPGGPDQSDLVTNWTTLGPEERWIDVPTTDGSRRGQFRYGFLTTPAAVPGLATTVEPGLLRIRVEGRVNGVRRSITADLRKPGFLGYVYYTDKETPHPEALTRRYYARLVALTPTEQEAHKDATRGTPLAVRHDGISGTRATRCDRHYYSTTDTTRRQDFINERGAVLWRDASGTVSWQEPVTVDRGYCDIVFVTGDIVDGPLYTRDAVKLDGSPLFQRKTESYWLPAWRTPSEMSTVWRGSGTPNPSGRKPEIATASVDMPPGNDAIRAQADPATFGTGCLYRGPTSIKLRSDGKMEVLSPGTTTTNPGCGTGLTTPQVVSLPPNGVVYVDPHPGASCTGKVLGRYPLAGEWEYANHSSAPREYDCTAGDAYVEGTLKGRLTLATAGHVWVTGNLDYAGGTTGVDVLGLVAVGSVKVWHPVGCGLSPAPVAPYDCATYTSDGPFTNLLSGTAVPSRIHAAILSVNQSFVVQNFDKAPKVTPKLLVYGGIYQRNRGTVGTGGNSTSGTGYLKDYRYDPRLVSLPPPHFLAPTQSAWTVVGSTEN